MSTKQIEEILTAMEATKKEALRSKEAALKFLQDADLLKYFPEEKKAGKKKG